MFGGVPDWVAKPKQKDEPKTHYEVELTPRMRDSLISLLRGGKVSEPTLKLIVRQLEIARLIDEPLYAARLDWAELEAEAKRQGCSVIDVFWDRAGHLS